MIFSIFRCFCTLRFQIYKYWPNHTSMEIWFNQLMHTYQFPKIDPYDWFCAPCSNIPHYNENSTYNYNKNSDKSYIVIVLFISHMKAVKYSVYSATALLLITEPCLQDNTRFILIYYIIKNYCIRLTETCSSPCISLIASNVMLCINASAKWLNAW